MILYDIPKDYTSLAQRAKQETGYVISEPALNYLTNDSSIVRFSKDWTTKIFSINIQPPITSVVAIENLGIKFDDKEAVMNIINSFPKLNSIILQIYKLAIDEIGFGEFTLLVEEDPESSDKTLILSLKTTKSPDTIVSLLNKIDKKMLSETDIASYPFFLFTVEY